MPRISINGVDLHVDDTGPTKAPSQRAPETIVFAHGLLWSGAMFAPQIAALRENYRCVAFDFRGQGLSGATADGYDMDTLTGDAAAVIAALDCGPCHFVGLSMGGFVGLRLAIRMPEVLRSLTLIDSAADEEPRKNIPKYRAMGVVARLGGLDWLIPAVEKIMFGQSFLGDPSRAETRALLRRRLRANDGTSAARATEGVISRSSVLEEARRIRLPTLVLHGEEDRAIVPERARRTAAAIEGAKLTFIARAGHTSTMEEPLAVTTALQSFLTSIAN